MTFEHSFKHSRPAGSAPLNEQCSSESAERLSSGAPAAHWNCEQQRRRAARARAEVAAGSWRRGGALRGQLKWAAWVHSCVLVFYLLASSLASAQFLFTYEINSESDDSRAPKSSLFDPSSFKIVTPAQLQSTYNRLASGAAPHADAPQHLLPPGGPSGEPAEGANSLLAGPPSAPEELPVAPQTEARPAEVQPPQQPQTQTQQQQQPQQTQPQQQASFLKQTSAALQSFAELFQLAPSSSPSPLGQSAAQLGQSAGPLDQQAEARSLHEHWTQQQQRAHQHHEQQAHAQPALHSFAATASPLASGPTQASLAPSQHHQSTHQSTQQHQQMQHQNQQQQQMHQQQHQQMQQQQIQQQQQNQQQQTPPAASYWLTANPLTPPDGNFLVEVRKPESAQASLVDNLLALANPRQSAGEPRLSSDTSAPQQSAHERHTLSSSLAQTHPQSSAQSSFLSTPTNYYPGPGKQTPAHAQGPKVAPQPFGGNQAQQQQQSSGEPPVHSHQARSLASFHKQPASFVSGPFGAPEEQTLQPPANEPANYSPHSLSGSNARGASLTQASPPASDLQALQAPPAHQQAAPVLKSAEESLMAFRQEQREQQQQHQQNAALMAGQLQLSAQQEHQHEADGARAGQHDAPTSASVGGARAGSHARAEAQPDRQRSVPPQEAGRAAGGAAPAPQPGYQVEQQQRSGAPTLGDIPKVSPQIYESFLLQRKDQFEKHMELLKQQQELNRLLEQKQKQLEASKQQELQRKRKKEELEELEARKKAIRQQQELETKQRLEREQRARQEKEERRRRAELAAEQERRRQQLAEREAARAREQRELKERERRQEQQAKLAAYLRQQEELRKLLELKQREEEAAARRRQLAPAPSGQPAGRLAMGWGAPVRSSRSRPTTSSSLSSSTSSSTSTSASTSTTGSGGGGTTLVETSSESPSVLAAPQTGPTRAAASLAAASLATSSLGPARLSSTTPLPAEVGASSQATGSGQARRAAQVAKASELRRRKQKASADEKLIREKIPLYSGAGKYGLYRGSSSLGANDSTLAELAKLLDSVSLPSSSSSTSSPSSPSSPSSSTTSSLISSLSATSDPTSGSGPGSSSSTTPAPWTEAPADAPPASSVVNFDDDVPRRSGRATTQTPVVSRSTWAPPLPVGRMSSSLGRNSTGGARAQQQQQRQGAHIGLASLPPDADNDGIPGRAGVEYPVLGEIPRTSFTCAKQPLNGYYADTETACQVVHLCQGGVQSSILCPNGTIFNQEKFSCQWWYEVNCSRAPKFYQLNDNLYKALPPSKRATSNQLDAADQDQEGSDSSSSINVNIRRLGVAAHHSHREQQGSSSAARSSA